MHAGASISMTKAPLCSPPARALEGRRSADPCPPGTLQRERESITWQLLPLEEPGSKRGSGGRQRFYEEL